jgi:hypothetical protein
MATFNSERMAVDHDRARALLTRGLQGGGHDYELAMMTCIKDRRIPVLERIEATTGVPVVGTTLERTRGSRSSQSMAWIQWQRGHRKEGTRWPDATLEFLGPRGVVSAVYALEFSLQSDFTRIGETRRCRMSMAKASQMALTTAILATKPAYAHAVVHYWYLCPWAPDESTVQGVLNPLQSLRGTERVELTWIQVDHEGPPNGAA